MQTKAGMALIETLAARLGAASVLTEAGDMAGHLVEARGLYTGEALAVTHGGLVYAIEGHLSGGWARLPNLGGRWVEVTDAGISLGERVILVDPHDVAVTTPGQI